MSKIQIKIHSILHNYTMYTDETIKIATSLSTGFINIDLNLLSFIRVVHNLEKGSIKIETNKGSK